MRIAFLRALVIGCGLLMTCEAGYADSIPVALADPTACPGTTPGGVVTCDIGNASGNIGVVTGISPTVGTLLLGSVGGTNEVTIASTQEMNASGTGQANKITNSAIP